MELLAGASFAWCCAYVLLSCYFAFLASRRSPEAIQYVTFAAGCVAVGVYAFCVGQHHHAADPWVSATWTRRAFYVAPFAGAFVVHCVALYAQVELRRRRRLVAMLYAGAAAVTTLHLTGATFDTRTVVARRHFIGATGYVEHAFPSRLPMAFSHAFVLLTAAALLAILVRAYLSGQTEALLACVGAIVVGVCVVSDTLSVNAVHAGPTLTEHGYSAFAFGLSYTLLAQHSRISAELEDKGDDLRRRARELKRSYEQLRAAQEQLVRREQLALIGEIAAVVSHEVRNPLAIITNAVAGLRRSETSAEDRATLLSILDEETERLNRLVGDLLRYARPIVIERTTLDLPALVRRALEIARARKDIELVVEPPSIDALSSVQGDASLLRQVFDNLVQNACQAMPSGGTLSVRVAEARDERGIGVNVEFADTGEGMDTQVRSRAGTPFFTTRPGGTGLGLAICDRIVAAHGGSLSITSRSGEGTVVAVFLPTGNPDEIAVGSSQPSSPIMTPAPLRAIRRPS